jgi:hypothetical protein
LHAIELPDELAERSLRLAQALGLAFAGIDLKLTPNKQAVACYLAGTPGEPVHCLDHRVGYPVSLVLAYCSSWMNNWLCSVLTSCCLLSVLAYMKLSTPTICSHISGTVTTLLLTLG